MPSEQATAAAENIASWLRLEAHQFPSDGNVAEWAEIIDAAFAPVVAELVAMLREARKVVNEIDSIMSESRGVSGYHLNGSIAEWDEFDDLSDSGAVVERIDEAIAKHGGAK